MVERVEAIGGTLAIQSNLGTGTRVTASVPVVAAAAPALTAQ
jgi:signal transduction histidine kinase